MSVKLYIVRHSGCTVSKMDLYFLLDGSGSIGSSNFQQSLDFVNQLASEFNISSEQVRTGLTIYSSSNYPISQFDQHQNNSAFSDAVINTNYPRGEMFEYEVIECYLDGRYV